MVVNNDAADYLTSIVNSLDELVFVFNEDGVIVDYLENQNTQWLYVPKDQFIGRRHDEVLPADVSEKIRNAISRMKAGENTFSFDYALTIGQRVLWFTASFSPLLRAERDYTRYLCVVREITERKEKELLLQGVLDSAFNSFIVLRGIRNQEGRVVDFEWMMINREAENLIGRKFHELERTTARAIEGQEWLLFDEYAAVAESGKMLDLEYSVYKDGAKRWLQTHVSRLEDRLIVTIKDITRQKVTEHHLQTVIDQLGVSRQAMDLFFSQALSGFFFMMLDEPLQWDDSVDKDAALDYAIDRLHFTRVNQALLEQYGAGEEEFLKLTLRDFFRNDMPNGRELLRQLYDEGRVLINRLSRRLDGSELWIEGNYICFKDGNNRILGHFGIQHDVTDRKRSENMLRASEERYRHLANNMLDLVALHDPDGTYTYLSPSVSRMLGYEPEELVGKNPYTLFHPDDIATIQQQSHIHAKAGKVVDNIEYRIRRKDGQYIWLSTNTKPIMNADGRVIMLQTVSRDVTERVRTMHILEEMNQQKNKLFSIIAHDLRGPLGSCMGLLNLSQNAQSPEDLQKYIRMAKKSAFNLHELMEDLLIWAGSQLDKIAFEPEILNIKEELENVSRRFVDNVAAKNIALTLDISDDSLTVFADRQMLRTITRNLVSNAVKFTRPGGKVEIRAYRRNGYVEIAIIDNGVGVPQEHLEQLFSKSSRFTTFGTGGEKGTGLGLDICRDFVERNHGKIWVESEVGRGSKFTIALREF